MRRADGVWMEAFYPLTGLVVGKWQGFFDSRHHVMLNGVKHLEERRIFFFLMIWVI